MHEPTSVPMSYQITYHVFKIKISKAERKIMGGKRNNVCQGMENL